MNERKFTKGKWEVNRNEIYPEGMFYSDQLICTLNNRLDKDANAQLIAAAPELYEALEGLLIEAEISLGHMDEPEEKFACSERIKWAKQALSRARGE